MSATAETSPDADPKTELKTLSVRERSTQVERLEDHAWRQRTSVSALVRHALRETYPDIYAEKAAA